jgi:hypothetical protein
MLLFWKFVEGFCGPLDMMSLDDTIEQKSQKEWMSYYDSEFYPDDNLNFIVCVVCFRRPWRQFCLDARAA